MSVATLLPTRRMAIRTTAAALVATILAVLPVFLLGAVAVLVTADLHLDEAELGLAVSSFYATTALTSVLGGRTADRLGASRGMAFGILASAVSLAGISVLARSWVTLTAFLVVAGMANGLAQPASNLALARGVGERRMGLAFGMKQSAIPIAGLVSGLVLPAVGLTAGWRWAFAGAALMAFAASMLAPGAVGRPDDGRTSSRESDAALGPLVVLAVGCAFGSAAGIALGAFLVQSTAAAGLSLGAAGLLLAVGGSVGVLTRLVAGWLADRHPWRLLTVVSAMLGVGSVGLAFLAVAGDSVAVLVTGTVLAFGLAWGWPGLFFLAIVRMSPGAPATASGLGQAGGATGGVLGPTLFGVIVTNTSYPVGWWTTCALALASATLMLVGQRGLERHRPVSASRRRASTPRSAERDPA